MPYRCTHHAFCCDFGLNLVQDTSQHQREALFQQKLKLCTVVFDMTDPMENSRSDTIKGQSNDEDPHVVGLTVYMG